MMNIEEIKEQLNEILPEGWEKKARDLGAFGRAREVKTELDLIILILLYATSGKSIGGTSTILKSSGEMSLNKNAVNERLQKSEEYLKWLIQNINEESGIIVKKPDWLENRQVLAVDATMEEVKYEGESEEYNLHYMTNVFTLDCVEVKATDEKTGEKLSNFQEIGKGDIVMGDRVYGTIQSMEYARNAGADYLIRLKSNAFNLYNEKGEKVDLEKKIRRMGESAYKKFDLYYKSGKELIPVHICVYRKDTTQIREKETRNMSKTRKFYDKYVIVATSLNETPDKILELYRLRWQIELLFKRLKSIFHLDELKAKTTKSVKIWFYCKLLLASICETLDNKGRFSPSVQISFGIRKQME
jgi:hypothetical protein